jgi:hypothetical protein
LLAVARFAVLALDAAGLAAADRVAAGLAAARFAAGLAAVDLAAAGLAAAAFAAGFAAVDLDAAGLAAALLAAAGFAGVRLAAVVLLVLDPAVRACGIFTPLRYVKL